MKQDSAAETRRVITGSVSNKHADQQSEASLKENETQVKLQRYTIGYRIKESEIGRSQCHATTNQTQNQRD